MVVVGGGSWWCVGGVLVVCWWCVGGVLVVCWWCAAAVMMLSKRNKIKNIPHSSRGNHTLLCRWRCGCACREPVKIVSKQNKKETYLCVQSCCDGVGVTCEHLTM